MATKKLSDNLRPASFRGVGFHVENTEFSTGRRVQVHEYPQRDQPYVEDLGRASRELDFQGFLVGEDYVEQANRLLAALEEPGAGTLVHPWFGTLQATLREKARVSFDTGLGRARVSMSFVEDGGLQFPAAATSTGAASRIAAGKLQTASVASFAEKFGIKGFQDFVTSAATGRLGDVLGIVSSSQVGKVLGLATGLARTVSTVISFIGTPSALGGKLMGAFGLSGVATTTAAWSSVVRSLSRVAQNGSLAKPVSSARTPSRKQATANTTAINALTRQALLVQAVGASSLVGTTLDRPDAGVVPGALGLDAAAEPKVSYQDMIGVRDDLLAALDAEMLDADDAVYAALQEARQAVYADMTSRARDSARLDTITPPGVLPALVVAYNYYGDAARDAEIVARNAIRHPGFVPVEPIKVLTR